MYVSEKSTISIEKMSPLTFLGNGVPIWSGRVYAFIFACLSALSPSGQQPWLHFYVLMHIMLIHQQGCVDAYRIERFNQTTGHRSGGFPKFAQSISSSTNKFINEIHKYNHESRYQPPYNRNSCGIRTINYSPKRSGRIIGGTYFPLAPLAVPLEIVQQFLRLIGFKCVVIVGLGHAAPYGAFPWQVEIQIFNYENGLYEHHCGAAVIGKWKKTTNDNLPMKVIVVNHN